MKQEFVDQLFAKHPPNQNGAEEFSLAAMALVHRTAGIPKQKRKELIKLERTVQLIGKIYYLEQTEGKIPIPKIIELMKQHKLEATAVYAKIGQKKWFDKLHNLKAGFCGKFIAGTDEMLENLATKHLKLISVYFQKPLLWILRTTLIMQ